MKYILKCAWKKRLLFNTRNLLFLKNILPNCATLVEFNIYLREEILEKSKCLSEDL